MTPNAHLSGQSCPKCGINTRSNKQKLTYDEVVRRAREIHGDKYDYSNFEYINYNYKSKIFCKKHKSFFVMAMHQHLSHNGCPLCNQSHLEQEIKIMLDNNKIKYNIEYNIDNLRLDFYLPEYNIAIECQGIQHFKPTNFCNTNDIQKTFESQLKRDLLKNKLCSDNNIKLLYFLNQENINLCININTIYNEENVFTDKNKLLNKIKGGI